MYNCVRCWQSRVLYGSWVTRVLFWLQAFPVMREGVFPDKKINENSIP